MHYYERGNFPSLFERDDAMQKPGFSKRGYGGRTGGGVRADCVATGNAGWRASKKKLSRRESANLKGDLGKFEETAASPSRAGYSSLPGVI